MFGPGFVPTRQGCYKKNIEGFVRQPAGLDWMDPAMILGMGPWSNVSIGFLRL